MQLCYILKNEPLCAEKFLTSRVQEDEHVLLKLWPRLQSTWLSIALRTVHKTRYPSDQQTEERRSVSLNIRESTWRPCWHHWRSLSKTEMRKPSKCAHGEPRHCHTTPMGEAWIGTLWALAKQTAFIAWQPHQSVPNKDGCPCSLKHTKKTSYLC